MTGFLDSPGRDAEGFWAEVTGSALSARRDGGRFATLVPAEGDAFLRVQIVDDGPPGGHLDFHVADVAAAAAEAREAGASVVSSADGLVVCRSPAGLAFCLVGWQGERVVPPPVRGSVVDQMCLDVPVADFDGELRFWAALAGWEPVSSDLGEFERLVRAPGQPLQLLFQRVGGSTPGMHVDLAAEDPAATVAWHESLGATVVRRRPGQWTTLRDPAGRDYCVTHRRPSS
ncbi:VOC family protein [Actinoplanes sp. NPDC051633]|uniref:VOC family protein n=1 Tax=Actinoplanes sp. NPDC051633 TaxID=3155670 RepID=UPI00342AAA10